MELTPGHPIKVVVRRTGLSAHVIRVWEKRYQAVVPARTETNRRLYSDEDIVRLQWLQQAVQAGQSIGRIAHLPTAELVKLVGTEQVPLAQKPTDGAGGEPGEFLARALVAVQKLDAVALEEQLVRASISLSQWHLFQEVVQPLMEHIGQMWQEGTLRIADEHLASAVVRSFIGNMRASFQVSEAAPSRRRNHASGAIARDRCLARFSGGHIRGLELDVSRTQPSGRGDRRSRRAKGS